MKNNQLFNASLIFFIFILTSVLFSVIVNKAKGYAISNSELVDQLINNEEAAFYFHELRMYLTSENGNIILVDLRTPEAFATSQLPNAVNIPFHEIKNKTHLKFLRKNNTVLYSDNESKTVLAFLMLKSLGIENMRYVPGHYQAISEHLNSPSYQFYTDDKAKWNYALYMNKRGAEAASNQNSKPEIPSPAENITPVRGGC